MKRLTPQVRQWLAENGRKGGSSRSAEAKTRAGKAGYAAMIKAMQKKLKESDSQNNTTNDNQG